MIIISQILLSGFIIIGLISGVYLSIRGIACLAAGNLKAGLVNLLAGIFISLFIGSLVLLPALWGPKTKSSRTYCMSNLAQIGKALKMYSMDHNECFPETLDPFVSVYIETNLLFCPSSGPKPKKGLRQYVYVPGLTESNESWIVAHCPAGSHQGKGGNALFVDGSVAWFSSESQRSQGSSGQSFEQMIKTGKDEPPGQEPADATQKTGELGK